MLELRHEQPAGITVAETNSQATIRALAEKHEVVEPEH